MVNKNKSFLKIFIPLQFALFGSFVLAEEVPVEALFTASPTELNDSWQIYKIKAHTLWAKEVSGRGVKIGVIDTGIYIHNELKPTLFNSVVTNKVLAGYNFVNNSIIQTNTSSDDNGHGTHVAGIIAANINNSAGTYNVAGVAPEALLIPIKVLDKNGSGNLTNLVKGLDFSVSSGALISSMSLGWSGRSGDANVAAALGRAVSAGQLLVIAAGNSGLSNPDWPARYAKDSFANGQIIAVGAVDANNNIAKWSNRAGDTQNFYLVAPGVNILSTYNQNDSSYTQMSGTSMATPVVAGAAALLKQGWNLSAQNIANILFTTATDLGTKGVDRIYGRGLLNLEAAMRPIGNPEFPALSGLKITSTSTLISTGAFTPSAYKTALANANLKVAGLDSFGRDFMYDLSSLYATNGYQDTTLSQIFNTLSFNASSREYKTQDSKLTLNQINNILDPTDQTNITNQQNTLTSMSYSKAFPDGQALAFGMNTNTNRFFGFSETPFEYNNFVSRKAFDNPYLGFNSYQNFIGFSMPLKNHWNISAALVNNFNAISRQSTDFSKISQSIDTNLTSQYIELTHQLQTNKLAISLGATSEKNGMLGGSAGPLFGVTNTSQTMFLSLKNVTKLSENTWLAASFNQGITLKDGGQASLVTSTSSLQSQSWSVGLLRNNILNENDRLGFAISQPLAVKSGTINLSLPIGLDYDSGIMQYENRTISMAPKTLAHDLELNYSTKISKDTNVSLNALYRVNPDNNSANPDQKVLSVIWQNWF